MTTYKSKNDYRKQTNNVEQRNDAKAQEIIGRIGEFEKKEDIKSQFAGIDYVVYIDTDDYQAECNIDVKVITLDVVKKWINKRLKKDEMNISWEIKQKQKDGKMGKGWGTKNGIKTELLLFIIEDGNEKGFYDYVIIDFKKLKKELSKPEVKNKFREVNTIRCIGNKREVLGVNYLININTLRELGVLVEAG